MNARVKVTLQSLCVFLASVGAAVADVEVSEAIEIARSGRWPHEKSESVTLQGHGFYIRPFKVVKTDGGLTAEGFFRHRHRGKDDRVHYSIVVNKGQPYKATLTKIEYRGVLNNEVVEFGLDAVGAAKGGGGGAAIVEAILVILKHANIQELLDGNWEAQAAIIVDAIGAHLDAEVN